MKKLLPIVMLLIGSGAGVGAGIFLRPEPVEEKQALSEEMEAEQDTQVEKDEGAADETSGPTAGMEYVRLPNQFVVPLVADDRISALVVMSLSMEVALGSTDTILLAEPKIRDSFLRVLFDHAAIGGFDGAFATTENMDVVRRKLRDIAQSIMGEDIVNDVLIFEVARQDY
ncbi:flagellar basal body-associated FliL family protein [uncultured Roseobacter sp.]|uniref:flagellar basal body-associated FliL family protein n=1 Tax=uncultured Roseobacter sp. TaxID=114847 RepID=UPI002601791B|nr:flagellar basal body-associated FliL family protein [uncultured Roseobacter sp.]